MTKITYDSVMSAGEASLGPDEFWIIDHAEGPLWDTASKRLDWPVMVFCDANKCDWDVAKESGFYLNRLHKPQPAEGG